MTARSTICAVTRRALVGCTEAQIVAITGHSLGDVRSILDAHYLHRDPAVVGVLHRVCVKAKIKNVTLHALRHTFASVAGDLGFSELTIAGLLGHSAPPRRLSHIGEGHYII